MSLMPKGMFENIVDLFQNPVLENQKRKEDLMNSYDNFKEVDVVYKDNNFIVEYHVTSDADYFTLEETTFSTQNIGSEWLSKANMLNTIVEYVNMNILK